jgi:hypothetical protein
VAQQRQPIDTGLAHERHDDVGLLRERVRLVGLVGQSVAEEVEQEHTARPAQLVEHGHEVVRRAGEAVQHEQGLVVLAVDRGHVDREDRVAGEGSVSTEGLPLGHGGCGHVNWKPW